MEYLNREYVLRSKVAPAGAKVIFVDLPFVGIDLLVTQVSCLFHQMSGVKVGVGECFVFISFCLLARR